MLKRFPFIKWNKRYELQLLKLWLIVFSDFSTVGICLTYLRSRTTDGSRGSRSTTFSLGSRVTTLSLGTRLTISTLRSEGKRRNTMTRASFHLKWCCICRTISVWMSNIMCDSYRSSSKSSGSRRSSLSTLALVKERGHFKLLLHPNLRWVSSIV